MDATKKTEPNVCYVLLRNDERASYCGVTNCMSRRIRQHNGMMGGGARYTRGHSWRTLCVVSGFENRAQALSFEWHVKRCPTLNGTPVRRRAHQLFVTLRHGSWWQRYPPCPTQICVRWYHSGWEPRWPFDSVPFALVCRTGEDVGGDSTHVTPEGLVLEHAATQDDHDPFQGDPLTVAEHEGPVTVPSEGNATAEDGILGKPVAAPSVPV